MKGRIFMYLFVFTLLLVIFQYVNSKSILEKYERDITQTKERVEKYKDSVSTLEDINDDLRYFNLEHNEEALTYLENQGVDISNLVPFIKDELYKLNEVKGEHPIVPYAPMTENGKVMINTVKILNHKWIIADFSDGKHWGELFLTYEIDKNKNVNYRLVEHFMYPPDTY